MKTYKKWPTDVSKIIGYKYVTLLGPLEKANLNTWASDWG
jgi:hypothetical protein